MNLEVTNERNPAELPIVSLMCSKQGFKHRSISQTKLVIENLEPKVAHEVMQAICFMSGCATLLVEPAPDLAEAAIRMRDALVAVRHLRNTDIVDRDFPEARDAADRAIRSCEPLLRSGALEAALPFKVFTCVGFKGVQPTCTAAVIVAIDEAAARTQLLDRLQTLNLIQEKDFELVLVEVNTSTIGATILANGDY